MTNYKCLIVDDNEIERDAIEMYLRKINRLDIVAVCKNGMEASDILATENIDIVFSDINMPDLSGFALLKTTFSEPVFIFITSFSEYAPEGFNLDALDFIVKPATFERLLKASNKAFEYLEMKKIVAYKIDLINNEPATDKYFFIKETNGFTRLNYSDVVYIESMGDFSKIYTADNKHITLVNLKNLELALPDEFLRVHKQFIINLNQIVTVTGLETILNHNFIVPVSALHKQDLMERITAKTIFRHKK